MKLYEFEGHRILNKAGIESPFFVVASSVDEIEQGIKRLKFPVVAKVQVLSGRRSKGGGVKICTNRKQLFDFAKANFNRDFQGEEVRFIALFEKIDIQGENYIAITYDSILKIPFLLFSQKGGVDIEDVKTNDPGALVRVDIDPLNGFNTKMLSKLGIPVDFALRLWDAFCRYDCRLIEVNPLAMTGERKFVAIDAKVILDDNGLLRQKNLDVLTKGATGAVPTAREVLAHRIDAEDYRGSAGSTFIELDGDIAILASGGGASLLVMDAVVAAGGNPANYTEYSGNPPRVKVEKLTEVTLSKVGLAGCLVAGAVANFTDIYETLGGFVDGLVKIKPKVQYPIVIRRGGPRLNEAFESLAKFAKKDEYDIHLFGPETPISVACKKMVELSQKFKAKNSKPKRYNSKVLS